MLKFLLRDIEAKRRFSIILAVSSSLFIYFFLVIFQPFGVNNYRPHDNFSPELLLGILPVIPVFLISILLLEFYLRPLFSRKFKWNAIA